MPPRKRQRPCGVTATAPPPPTLPADLLVEIVARTDDAPTLFRCAAACRLLRREILDPAFGRRVRSRWPDGGVLLGFLCPGNATLFSLVHPGTPEAASLADNHLARFMSRSAADLLEEYEHVTSRGGLVVLERREAYLARRRLDGDRASDMCVWNPMTGDRAFLPFPPDVWPDVWPPPGDHLCPVHTYVLLTGAADGIGSPFLLLAADLSGLGDSSRCIKVRTVSSDAGGSWGPVMTHAGDPGMPLGVPSIGDNGRVVDDAVVGVVHWLMCGYILTYDVGAAAVGMIELPGDGLRHYILYLGSTPEGNLSLFYSLHGFTIFYWVMSSPGGGWRLRAEVDTFPMLRSMMPMAPWEEEEEDNDDDDYYDGDRKFMMKHDSRVDVEGIGDKRSSFLLLWFGYWRFVLDLETAKIHWADGWAKYGIPYTVDLSSRLSAMKSY
ncbi:hypothetical protein ACP70R_019737 [Stipagrostis hirtigluma subsp. patula]